MLAHSAGEAMYRRSASRTSSDLVRCSFFCKAATCFAIEGGIEMVKVTEIRDMV